MAGDQRWPGQAGYPGRPDGARSNAGKPELRRYRGGPRRRWANPHRQPLAVAVSLAVVVAVTINFAFTESGADRHSGRNGDCFANQLACAVGVAGRFGGAVRFRYRVIGQPIGLFVDGRRQLA